MPVNEYSLDEIEHWMHDRLVIFPRKTFNLMDRFVLDMLSGEERSRYVRGNKHLFFGIDNFPIVDEPNENMQRIFEEVTDSTVYYIRKEKLKTWFEYTPETKTFLNRCNAKRNNALGLYHENKTVNKNEVKRMKRERKKEHMFAPAYEIPCWHCRKKIHFFEDMEYARMDNTSSTKKYYVDCPKCGAVLLTREELRDGEINDFRNFFG